jgi:hypothetical protein
MKRSAHKFVTHVGKKNIYKVFSGGTDNHPLVVIKDMSTGETIAVHQDDVQHVINAMQMTDIYLGLPE